MTTGWVKINRIGNIVHIFSKMLLSRVTFFLTKSWTKSHEHWMASLTLRGIVYKLYCLQVLFTSFYAWNTDWGITWHIIHFVKLCFFQHIFCCSFMFIHAIISSKEEEIICLERIQFLFFHNHFSATSSIFHQSNINFLSSNHADATTQQNSIFRTSKL